MVNPSLKLCLGLVIIFSQLAVSAPLSPEEALVFWEIHANPDIVDPNVMSSLVFDGMNGDRVVRGPVEKKKPFFEFYTLPSDQVRVETVGSVPASITFLLKQGANHIRFPKQVDDRGILAEAIGTQEPPQVSNIVLNRSASRSSFLFSLKLSFKGSTYTTYGGNPNKVFGGTLAEDHLEVNRRISEVEFKYGLPVREPVFLFYKNLAVSVRDWSPFLNNNNFYMPLFSFSHNHASSVLALLNGYVDPQLFYLEKVVYNNARAQTEWATKTGLEFETPHHQQFLAILDSEYQVNSQGRQLFRDYGDSNLSAAMLKKLNLTPSSGKISLTEGPYIFTVPEGDKAAWSTSTFGNEVKRYFAQGVYDYLSSAPGLSSKLSRVVEFAYRNSSFKLALVDDIEAQTYGRKGIPSDSKLTESIRLRQQRTLRVPERLSRLIGLVRESLKLQVTGQAFSSALQNELQVAFASEKDFLLRLRGELGSLVRSQLVWAGVQDSGLFLRQVRDAINPLELEKIWKQIKDSSSAEAQTIRAAFLERISKMTPYSSYERSGMTSGVVDHVDGWLRAGPTLSRVERIAALKFYLSEMALGSTENNVKRLFANASEVEPEEKRLLEAYLRSRSISDADQSLVKASKLPVSRLGQQTCKILMQGSKAK